MGEVAEPLTGHPQQVDQLRVMRVGHEHFYKALHKPCAMLVVPLELDSKGAEMLYLFTSNLHNQEWLSRL